jgi:hypothetical protein
MVGLHSLVLYCLELPNGERAALKLGGKVDLSINRVRGMWAQCKDLKGWYERFREEQNIYTDQCDVLMFNTVIGAGFSIAFTRSKKSIASTSSS